MACAENAFSEIVGDQAFVIVGEDEGVEVLQRSKQRAQEALFGFRPQRFAALAIDAHDLLMARDDARFDCGHTPWVSESAFINNVIVAKAIAQRGARFIISDDTEAFHACFEREKIRSNFSRPAEAFALLDEIYDGNRGFRRQARGGTPKIA